MASLTPKNPLSARQSKSQALDDLIMGTNSSSIVSKRSVERLYYPNEAHFFRYFVTKFQRRAPLINRGYWLRLRAIDVIVHQFLKSSSSGQKKVVVNLGCGSDVLPWQCHTRYKDDCENTVFIDIDYPDLMRKKRSIVLGTPQLRELLGSDPIISEHDTDQVLLRSEKYCQLGCDLRKLDALRQCLETFLPLSECSVLFVAEVSITYMDTESADALIHWASSIGHAEFCLLEQILPSGADHPFARTMLSHFNKLNTPLKSVHKYPTLESQRYRFRDRGWNQIGIWDLWEAWNSGYFLSTSERIALDHVEPFDEWEEFVLFARHYFVMYAKVVPIPITHPKTDPGRPISQPSLNLSIKRYEPSTPKRRFGSSMIATNPEGQHYAMHAFGIGSNGRVPSCDVYTLEGASISLDLSPVGPSARMCHTTTDLGPFGVLLVGGRASPTSALSDCWILKKDTKLWEKTYDLPYPLFRHTTVRLRGSSLVLVFGGKMGPSQTSSAFFLFHPTKGWVQCETSSPLPNTVFGAVAVSSLEDSQHVSRVFNGLFSGGITQEGKINTKVYRWRLDITGTSPLLNFEEIQDLGKLGDGLSVFGAQTAETSSYTAVCGGVGCDASSQGQDVALVKLAGELQVDLSRPSKTDTIKWPLMIGSSVISFKDQLFLVGGGATCFSMGTFWETGSYAINTFSITSDQSGPGGLIGKHAGFRYLDSPKVTHAVADLTKQTDSVTETILTNIPRLKLGSEAEFREILRNRKPVIIEDLRFGGCVEDWSPEGMVKLVGETKEVIVHECQMDTEKMDFNSKNFRYVTESFGAFMKKAERGERLYLRSLSEHKPSESPANINDDFPSLAAICHLPQELGYVMENLFSSVLRVSGRVNMWLHYDVMANIYTQIRGSKRMVLFPPTDVNQLAFAPGASSSSLDVFSALEKQGLAGTHPHEALLREGDALFLPAMWFHTATPTADLSVAVNYFFRDLENGYSPGRDVYGNRDLVAYEKGRQEVTRIAKGFDRLPPEIRQFYLSRLADELLHEQVQ